MTVPAVRASFSPPRPEPGVRSLPSERLHGLDALRAAALLAGILLHSSMSFVEPQGLFAPVGTSSPQPFLHWLIYYIHSVRLEVFFLLAGFFGAMVVGRQGVQSYLRDRFVRVFLVFLVFLYPIKYVATAVWVSGYLKTGLWQIPAALEGASPFKLPVVWLMTESWPSINTVHLWFLYLLSYFVVAAAAAHWIHKRIFPSIEEGPLWAVRRASDAVATRLMKSPFAPFLLAVLVTPLIARMGGHVDTPGTFVLQKAVSALYLVFFALGWWLYGRRELLEVVVRRWKLLLVVGLLASVVGWGLLTQNVGEAWPIDRTQALWLSSFARALTATAGTIGWVGAFLYAFRRPSDRVRYVANSSYWVYIAHHPLVMAMQVWLFGLNLPWWIQIPLINLASGVVLFVSYHYLVRDRWLGNWLNGRRPNRSMHLVSDGVRGDQISVSVNG